MVCLTLLAPACLAQSHAGDDASRADPEASASAEDAPRRSAMGRVMGIMIEALRQEAMRSTPEGADGAMRSRVAGSAETLDIEVGDAFRLQPPARASAAPKCGVQPCDRDSVPNLRIASQK
jgi:hypothetical protein